MPMIVAMSQTQTPPRSEREAPPEPDAASGLHRFPTAPTWYRPVLEAEQLVLRRVQSRLPHNADLHGADADTADYKTSGLGIKSGERIVPGGNASPYMLEHVARYTWAMGVARSGSVVDLGCGDGYGTLMLSWTASRATGIDRSQTAIDRAIDRYAPVTFVSGDLDLPATIPHADLAVCFEVLEHVRNPTGLLQTIAERAGRLLVSFPNPLAGGSHINPHHVNDWPLSKLKHELRSAGARRLRGYHQRRGDTIVRRGAHPWHLTWLFDVEFAAREP
jgi:SAM-dependent methyltransferase